MRSQFGESGWANDEMKGIGYLFALRELANDIDKKWKSVLKKLETIRELLINRRALICNVTLDAKNWQAFRPQLESFLSAPGFSFLIVTHDRRFLERRFWPVSGWPKFNDYITSVRHGGEVLSSPTR